MAMAMAKKNEAKATAPAELAEGFAQAAAECKSAGDIPGAQLMARLVMLAKNFDELGGRLRDVEARGAEAEAGVGQLRESISAGLPPLAAQVDALAKVVAQMRGAPEAPPNGDSEKPGDAAPDAPGTASPAEAAAAVPGASGEAAPRRRRA